MAEVSGFVPTDELNDLVDKILADGNRNGDEVTYDRKKWNKAIQDVCFNPIKEYVETYDKDHPQRKRRT